MTPPARVTVETSKVPTAEVLAIRRTVFIEEQGIPEADELDGTDGGCTHWVLREDGRAVATLRTRVKGEELRIGRVATLIEVREQGYARHLMERAMAYGRDQGLKRAYLSAQEDVVAWYRRFGFRPEGAFYDDGGIPHCDMRTDL